MKRAKSMNDVNSQEAIQIDIFWCLILKWIFSMQHFKYLCLKKILKVKF